MGRTCVYSLAGAGIGFLAGVGIVRVMIGTSPPSDTTAVTMLVGVFLAGCGAIAGAIGGAVEFLKARQPRSEEPMRRESEHD